MSELEYIELRITNRKPDEFDISELMEMLKNVETLLYPTPAEKKSRPTVSCVIGEGSVINRIKTLASRVLIVNAIFGEMAVAKTLDRLDSNRAAAIQGIQQWASKNNLKLELKTSLENSNLVEVNSETNYTVTESYWYDTEIYLYGKVVLIGGASKPSFHLYTKYGLVAVRTNESVLAKLEGNYMYREIGVLVSTKQSILSDEIDKKDITLIELLDYDPRYDHEYLPNLIKQSSGAWDDVEDVEGWLAEMRGYPYE